MRSRSEALTKRMLQCCTESALGKNLTAISRLPAVLPLTACSSVALSEESPTTPITNGPFGLGNALAGHSTNCAKL
jgi:hypothetical protein